jgi:hypothetical protein
VMFDEGRPLAVDCLDHFSISCTASAHDKASNSRLACGMKIYMERMVAVLEKARRG